MRFYDPDEGIILVDGHDIREYDLHHLRQQIGLVSQEPVLFNGTIAENIKYTDPQATDDAMREAAKQANALGFIERNEFQEVVEAASKNMGSGFERLVGPKGSQISGGQKQRIAIARVIVKNPKVYLFDEATSALDTVSEKVVQESLNALMVNHTSISIAHRLSTIKDSDEIFVLFKGEIVERGTYDQLLTHQGIFYKMERGILTDLHAQS
jgi:ATP-binding cassette subfamily B (MDR/TAP) protein 1